MLPRPPYYPPPPRSFRWLLKSYRGSGKGRQCSFEMVGIQRLIKIYFSFLPYWNHFFSPHFVYLERNWHSKCAMLDNCIVAKWVFSHRPCNWNSLVPIQAFINRTRLFGLCLGSFTCLYAVRSFTSQLFSLSLC